MTNLNFQTYRLQLVREEAVTAPAPSIAAPSDVSHQLMPLFAALDREHFVVLALDARNRPIGAHTVSVGSLSASIVHPREAEKQSPATIRPLAHRFFFKASPGPAALHRRRANQRESKTRPVLRTPDGSGQPSPSQRGGQP